MPAGHSPGAARALVEATVKDSAAHAETRGEAITISQSPLLITAIPEGGTLVPNIENEIFLLASYPDGSPALAALTVHNPNDLGPIPFVGDQSAQDLHLNTDSAGIAILHIKPISGMDSLRIEADDRHGSRLSSTVPLQTRCGANQVLLHTNRAIYRTGDRIELKVLSTRTHGSAYVDIVKNGQTILTRDLDLDSGQAELTLDATSEMAGILDIDAYIFGRDAQPIADHRLVFVQPAEELKIKTTTDATEYRPGSEARVQFHITNARGEGVQAALGIQVVDEAVFALAEKKPGFAKTFFYLEQEVMKPRYEIHSLSMDDVLENKDASQDLAARTLFSATEMTNPSKLDVEFGRSLTQDRFENYQQRYRAAFEDQVRLLAVKLSQLRAEQHMGAEIEKQFSVLENGTTPRDAWGTPLRIEPVRWYSSSDHIYLIRSAGPDRDFDNDDDLTVYIEDRSGTLVNEPSQRGSINLRIEHDRGPDNGRAEVTGSSRMPPVQ